MSRESNKPSIISIYDFMSKESEEPTYEIKCDKELLSKSFKAVDIEFENNDIIYISKELFEKIEYRFTKPHDTFLKKIGKSGTIENNISPIEYRFNNSHLYNIAYLALYYHKYLYDLWSQPKNLKITKDIKTSKSDVINIEKFLDRNQDMDIISSTHHNVIIRTDAYLEIKSYIVTSAIIDYLKRIINRNSIQIKNDKKLKNLLELIDMDVSKYGNTGRGKNYNVELTQSFTWHLFTFIKGNNVILPKAKDMILSDRKYYSFISDLYSLVTLPKMKIRNQPDLVWDISSEDYDKTEQIKRIESWIYNYKKRNKK